MSDDLIAGATADAGRARAGEIALRLAVPAFGTAFALLLLSMSFGLMGAAGWYARILVVLVGAISVYSLVVELVRLRRAPVVAAVDDETSTADDEPAPPGGVRRVVILVASIVAMIALAGVLGFWVSTLIPVVTALVILGVRPVKAAIAAVLTVGAGFVVFQVLLGIRFTSGMLGLI